MNLSKNDLQGGIAGARLQHSSFILILNHPNEQSCNYFSLPACAPSAVHVFTVHGAFHVLQLEL